MPRRPRMYLPGFPYHVVQRGNNREPCFLDTKSYAIYLDLLSQALARHQTQLHAYVLMTNHVHLLMTPLVEDGISQTMKVLASRYACISNRLHGRTGTLWEGRHKSSIVQAETYLLACYRYIELNPVAAGMVGRPEQYRWSSHGTNAYGHSCGWITPHPAYLALGATMDYRLSAYRKLFPLAAAGAYDEKIREAAHYCQPLGDDEFRYRIEQRLGRKVGQVRNGRPKMRSQNLVEF